MKFMIFASVAAILGSTIATPVTVSVWHFQSMWLTQSYSAMGKLSQAFSLHSGSLKTRRLQYQGYSKILALHQLKMLKLYLLYLRLQLDSKQPNDICNVSNIDSAQSVGHTCAACTIFLICHTHDTYL